VNKSANQNLSIQTEPKIKTCSSFLKKLKNPMSSKISKVIIIISLFFSLSALFLFIFFTSQYKTLIIKPPQIEKKPLTLTIQSPTDASVLSDNVITVKGVTLPNTTVMFYTESDENSVESDASGNFEGEINLENGINTLIVWAFADTGEEKSMIMDLVYDETVKGKTTSSNPPGQDKTPPGQAKKAEQLYQTAIVGDVKKINPGSLVVKEKNKNINTETLIDQDTKIVGKDKQDLNLNSLQSKKNQAAIVTQDSATPGAQLKKALKVYVREASTSAQMKRRAVHGVITNISGNTVTVAHQIQRERINNIQVSDITEVKIKGLIDASIADLDIGQRIAAVGDLIENQILAKRIHVIPGKAVGIFERLPVTRESTDSGDLNPSPSATISASPEETPLASPVLESPTPVLPSPSLEATPSSLPL
jgi:hypothetical protein